MDDQLVVEGMDIPYVECRRAYPRMDVDWKGCIYSNRESTICWIVNVGLTGARIRAPHPLRRMPGPVLSIDGIGHFPCQIVWADRTEYGVAFLEPPEQLEQFLGFTLPTPQSQ